MSDIKPELTINGVPVNANWEVIEQQGIPTTYTVLFKFTDHQYKQAVLDKEKRLRLFLKKPDKTPVK